MLRRNWIARGSVVAVVGTLVGVLAWANVTEVDKNQIEVEARFTVLNGSDTDLLSAPKVTTHEGSDAAIKVVTEHHCPNGELVEAGVILNVTPTLRDGIVNIKGSALVVNSVVPDKKDLEKNVQWIGFKEVKATFSVEAMDPAKQYRLGPIEMNGKKHEIWLSAHQVTE